MKVLVTGTQGQVARSLIERAANHPDIEAIAIGRPHLNLEQPGSAQRVVAQVSPDVVINAAAYTAVDAAEDEPKRAFRVNADGAGEVAAAAARVGARLIQLSTDYVFDGSAADPYDEDAAPNPLGVYGKSKLAGEEQVRSAASDHVIVRTAWVYSPFGRNFVKTMMSAAARGTPLTVVSDQHGSPSCALDLATGLLKIVERWKTEPAAGLGQTFHLAGTGSTSWFGFAQAIMDECRKHGAPAVDVQPISSAEWPTKAPRPANSVLNSCKFEREFGYSPPPWEQSLAIVAGRLFDAR
jgi:dTDP-4-dehydrorhamnose reductase